MYSIEGVMTKVSRALNIPQQTLSEWKNHSDWWPELTAEVRSEKEDHIAAQLTKIVERANEETIDRLENGDVYVHQGEITRAPIKAKDSAVIMGIGTEKLRLIQNKATTITGKQETLTDLLEQFREISRAIHRDENRVISDQ